MASSGIWKTLDGYELVVAIICCSGWIGASFLSPSPMYLAANNPEYSYPYIKNEKVSVVWLVFMSFPFTWLFFTLMKFLSKKFPQQMRCFSFWTTFWVHMTNVAMTNLVVILIQNYVGRAAPDFFSRCGPDATPDKCPLLNEQTLNEELRAFPSSHAATSVSSLLFLSLFIRKLFTSDLSIVTLSSAAPTFVALWIGATRIKDYREHASDVVAGYIIGVLSAYLMFEGSKKRIFSGSDINSIESMHSV